MLGKQHMHLQRAPQIFKMQPCHFASDSFKPVHIQDCGIPLAHKRKRGKPANTVSALQRQPDELQCSPQVELCSEVKVPLENNILPEAAPVIKVPGKRGRPKKQTVETELPLPEIRASKRFKKD